jgi:hypothetical protein
LNHTSSRGDEFDSETLDFACFESILFKKAYYLKWPKIDFGIFVPAIYQPHCTVSVSEH